MKCYGRIKKSVPVENPLVKEFFGDEDYKTSLWDFDSPKRNDSEKENKQLKKAGRRKKLNNDCFHVNSPYAFNASFRNSVNSKLKSMKGNKKNTNNNCKKKPFPNKRKMQTRLREKVNEMNTSEIHDAQIQPRWSDIEDHSLFVERLERSENNVSIKCISRIQDYDNLSSNKENHPLDVIVLSKRTNSFLTSEDNISRKKSMLNRLTDINNSFSLNKSNAHEENFVKASIENQTSVANHSKELKNILPMLSSSHVCVIQSLNQTISKHSLECNSISEVVSAEKKIDNFFENSTNMKSLYTQKLSASQNSTVPGQNTSIVNLNSDVVAESFHKNKSSIFKNSKSFFRVNHTMEKCKNVLPSLISSQMSPVYSNIAVEETGKNNDNHCMYSSESAIITSTPFAKHKIFEDSVVDDYNFSGFSDNVLQNIDSMTNMMQVSHKKSSLCNTFSCLQASDLKKSILNLNSTKSGRKCTLSQYNISTLFSWKKSSHSLCDNQVPVFLESSISKRSCTSKITLPNVSLTSQTKHEIEEAKSKLLKLCNQDSVIKFSEVLKWSSLHVKKIGEGTYGEVFIITKGKTSTVLKIIPVSEEIGDDSFQGLQNVLSEVKIAHCLSDLRNKKNNRTKNFNKLKRAHLVIGEYPDALISAWDSFSEAKSTYNDRPDFFSDMQLFIILEQEYGGKDMSSFVLRNAVEAESVFKQIAISLAIAEEEYLFEHRDLHLGNILVQRNKSKKVSYVLRGKPFSLKNHGLLVTIIDFTLSRLCETEYVYYNNLADDESLFNQSGDYQFEIYRAMKEHLRNQWHECELYSNVLWLNFLCVKLRNYSYSRPSSASHTKALKLLESIEKQLTSCNSVLHCLSTCKIVENIPCLNRKRDTRLSSNSILVSRNSFQKSRTSINP